MTLIQPERKPPSPSLSSVPRTGQEKTLLERFEAVTQKMTQAEHDILLGQMQRMQDNLQTEGLTEEEKKILTSEVVLSLQMPNLEPPAKTLLNDFLTQLKNAPPPAPGSTQKLTIQAAKAWLSTSAAVFLFIKMQGIITKLAQSKYNQAITQINVSKAQIDAAKQIFEMAVTQGELAAKICEQEAAKAALDATVALGQLVMTSMQTLYRAAETGYQTKLHQQDQLREWQQAVPPQHPEISKWEDVPVTLTMKTGIEQTVENKIRQFSSFTESLMGTVRGFGEANIAMVKAELEKLKGTVEGTKGLVERITQMLESAVRQLQTGRDEVDQQLSKYMDLLRSVLQAVGEVFSA